MPTTTFSLVATSTLLVLCSPITIGQSSGQESGTSTDSAKPVEASAVAQDDEAPAGKGARRQAPVELPEVVITASPDDEALYKTPIDYGATRDVISPQRVRESGAQNTQELLHATPSVFFFEETGTDSKPNIAVRGVTSNSEGSSRSANVSLLADGVPLAPAPYGHAGQSLFPFTLERVNAVDIIRGGRTVRYGPNTVSGIINFLTKPIPDRPTFEQRFRVDTHENNSSYTSAGGTYGKLGVLSEAVYKDGSTFRQHGDHTIKNFSLKTAYDFSKDLRALFQFEYFDDDSDLAGGLKRYAFQNDPEQSHARRDRFVGDQTRGNFRVEWDIDDDSSLDVTGYVFGGDRTFFLGKPAGYGDNPDYIDSTPRPMSVWALQPQYSRRYELDGLSGEAVIGIRHHVEDITRRSVRTYADNTVLVRSDNRYDYTVWSAFVENTFRADRFSITPGVRMEFVDMDGTNQLTGETVNRDFSEVLPALNGSYLLKDEWSLYANVQSSFLPPQANHIEISALPQNVDAQYAWTYEVGTRGTMWDGLISPDLAFYWIDYRGRIERDPNDNNIFLNRGNTTHKGVELSFDGSMGAASESLEGLGWFGSLSYNQSEYTNGQFDGNDVPHAPHVMASWGTSYHHDPSGLWGGIDGFFVGPAFADSANTVDISSDGMHGERQSYTVWNARLGFDYELAEGVALQLQVGGNNLLDEEYFEIRAGKGLFLGTPRGAYSVIGIKATL